MRLTLRALLNYMNGQLKDPKDAEEIGKKIEESKYATELFHKIRDVMRRLRLAAPSLTERGTNLDCNTVAEYLDNALPTDRVSDFEEVTLTSEMHLAEVASCHQILSMVLCEPAEIDPGSRQRMYQLPTVANRVDEERQAAVEAASMLSGDGAAGVPSAPPTKARPRPVVPEYLRDQPKKSRLLPTAAITLLVGAAIGLMLVMFYPNALQWVQAKFQGQQAGDEERDEGDGKKLGSSSGNGITGSNSVAGIDSVAGVNGEVAPKSSESAANAPAAELVAPVIGNSMGNPAAIADKREVPGTEKSSGKPLEKTPENPIAGNPVSEKPAVAMPGKAPGAAGLPIPAVGGPSLPPAGTAGSTASVATTPPAAETKPGGGEKSPPAVAGPDLASPDLKGAEPKTLPGGPVVGALLTKPAVGPANPPPSDEDKMKIGRFMSDGQDVLLKKDNAEWRRVLPEEFLGGHQPLLALPSYRSRVAVLNVNATLELINGTRIELLPDNAQGLPGVDIDFGRMVIKPLAQAGTRLRVVVGSHAGTITLTGVESIAGLEVTRVHEPGTDPEKVFSHALTKLYVARGGAVWEEGEGKPPVRLTAPAELMLDGVEADRPPGVAKEMPKWITTNTINDLDQRAALSVSQALSANRAASLGLMELADPQEHRKENRWLATRCLGYLGQFDPMTAALNNVDFRREWTDYIDQLKEAIARGPETAAGIRQSLDKQYGNESAALYRMLWGYTDKDLEDGEDARLVKFLDHEVTAFRVLAFENLRVITQKTLYYHPEAPTAAKRSAWVPQWQRLLQTGRIRFNVPDVKPRSTPAVPSKEGIPNPPKPLEGGTPGEVKQTSATEPVAPGPLGPRPTLSDNPLTPELGAAGALSQRRSPISVPEPEPREKRSQIVFPEPQPENGP